MGKGMVLQVRVTEEEMGWLRDESEAAGMSVARYVREVCLASGKKAQQSTGEAGRQTGRRSESLSAAKPSRPKCECSPTLVKMGVHKGECPVIGL